MPPLPPFLSVGSKRTRWEGEKGSRTTLPEDHPNPREGGQASGMSDGEFLLEFRDDPSVANRTTPVWKELVGRACIQRDGLDPARVGPFERRRSAILKADDGDAPARANPMDGNGRGAKSSRTWNQSGERDGCTVQGERASKGGRENSQARERPPRCDLQPLHVFFETHEPGPA